MSPTRLEPPGGSRDEAPTITDRTRFTWPVVLVLAGLAFSAAGGIALANSADDKADKAVAATEEQAKALHAHELRIQRVEDAVSEIKTSNAENTAEIKAAIRELGQKLDKLRDEKRGGK